MDGVYYWDYLALDDLLDAQHLESAHDGSPGAHDEMLFVIVHQAYELWFKQILWELDAVLAIFGGDEVPEREVGSAVHHLERIREIQRVLLAQFDVLETMTPLDFLDFRDELRPASGFQSVQFRMIENKLGLRRDHRMQISGRPYTAVLRPEHAALVEASEHVPSLRDLLDAWLARTPFLRFGDFDFWAEYSDAVERMLDGERDVIATNPHLTDQDKQEHLAEFDATATTFATLFDREQYDRLRAAGDRSLSQDAFLAALLISLYRDQPVLQMPFRLLTALVDLDEGFTQFRQRHALMAHRMLGAKTGTGGTAGHRYLRAAADKHTVFGDLFDLSTYHVPRSALPKLPPELERELSFAFGHTGRRQGGGE